MKPVITFQFVAHEGPGYLATFLDAQNIPFELVSIDKGDVLPDSISAYSGMVLMGGPMSANDDLPWMKPLISLILAAKATDIPMLGHCLGGQLILSSPHCANQGYVIGKHLVLQTHIEVSSDMVKNWCVEGAEELAGQ